MLLLGDRPYLVRNNEKEGRFGIDEEPKFWVKRSVDLIDGRMKVIKLVFHEHFRSRIGPLVFDCVRSPVKEARVISLVSGHPNFMQGLSVKDPAGNAVRVLDFIKGEKLHSLIQGIGKDHYHYFHEDFPEIFRDYIEAVQAIIYLHERNEIHGDIRRDHLIKDKETGKLRWIDLDFTYGATENKFGLDIFGLGNILAFIVGGGDITIQELKKEREDIYSRLIEEDLNVVFGNRVAALKKIFPYINGRPADGHRQQYNTCYGHRKRSRRRTDDSCGRNRRVCGDISGRQVQGGEAAAVRRAHGGDDGRRCK
ncbi:MAG: hypothetical protein M0Z61_12405 [Nitrospiraceae bacterium]|nr:hypothetical protein [Nitrospiraceae bacterium]